VVGIIVLLVKHFGLADDIMRVLKATVGVVWGFIKATIGTVVKLVVGYFKLWIAAIGFVVKAVSAIAGVVGRAFAAVYNAIKNWLGAAARFITGFWAAEIRFFAGLGGKLARAGGKMWGWLVDGAKAAVNLVVGVINRMIQALNAVQIHVHINPPGPGQIDFDWSGLGIPYVPSLMYGGTVARTGLAVVHEGERFSGVGGGWGAVNVYVSGSVIAEHDLAEAVQKALLKSKRRSGVLGLS
jgi:hypothetical protein